MSFGVAHNARMNSRLVLLAIVLLLGACASAPPPAAAPAPPARAAPPPEVPKPEAAKPQPPHYRCEGGLEFDVRFGDSSVELVFKSREPETLLRDAGGTSPEHKVYSNTKAKAEFGLDPEGRGAQVNFADPALSARCTRD